MDVEEQIRGLELIQKVLPVFTAISDNNTIIARDIINDDLVSRKQFAEYIMGLYYFSHILIRDIAEDRGTTDGEIIHFYAKEIAKQRSELECQ